MKNDFKILLIKTNKHRRGHFEALLNTKINCLTKNLITHEVLDLAETHIGQYKSIFSEILKQSKGNRVVVDVEWVHDISDIKYVDHIFDILAIDWITTGSISRFCYRKESELEEKLVGTIPQLNRLKRLMIWDEIAVEKLQHIYPQLHWIPDLQSTRTSLERCILCESKLSNDFVVGHFGQMFPYRGIERLLQLSEKDDGFSMILAGELKFSDLNYRIKKILLKKITEKRLFLFPQWYENEDMLNHLYKHIDAFFLDNDQYPQPSGFVSKAWSYGIPLIIQNVPSYYQVKCTKGNDMIVYEPKEGTNLSSLIPEVNSIREKDTKITIATEELFAKAYLSELSRSN